MIARVCRTASQDALQGNALDAIIMIHGMVLVKINRLHLDASGQQARQCPISRYCT
jgi:hypothetical protein